MKDEQRIPLSRILLKTNLSGLKYVSSSLYTFHALAGDYKLQIVKDAMGSSLGQVIGKRVQTLGWKFDADQYFMLIKEHHNPLKIIAFACLCILSFVCCALGIILPLYILR